MAGARREREEAAAAVAAAAATTTTDPAVGEPVTAELAAATGRRSGARRRAAQARTGRRGFPALAAVLTALCVLAAAGVGYLVWERMHPRSVDDGIFAAARSSVEDLYAYDYQDSEGSLDRKLAVLTGDLREQYEQELSQGGILDTYEQVSATTSYEVLDIGLQQVNDAQDTATVVVFGRYVAPVGDQRERAGPGGLGVRGHARGRPVLRADHPARHGAGRRRLEDQRAHPADDQLTPVPGVAVGALRRAWHHGCTARSADRVEPDVAPVAPVPLAWTSRNSRGRVSCCAAL
ncbi:hypothetical protein JKP76_07530 [Blastococcus sp. TML/C7B]|uniref:hypothetical protein n=1 Tax=Blastococcus sp. TML/C7B TaxID=2798728 RepID=UPI0019097BC7|nr:hypothetical protein [Blastococcus sp. TML/C7B]MBN1095891.1 hypothetical protein [Blastococcus sp. TML/C7B]